MPDFLDEKRREIAARLKELRPLVEEHERLTAAASALDGLGATSPARGDGVATSATSSGKRRGRPRGSKNAASTATTAKTTPAKAKGKGGRRKGSGIRSSEALTFIKEKPGIRMAELAEQMGIQTNYLYRVVPDLEKEGKVERKGRGWHPTSAA